MNPITKDLHKLTIDEAIEFLDDLQVRCLSEVHGPADGRIPEIQQYVKLGYVISLLKEFDKLKKVYELETESTKPDLKLAKKIINNKEDTFNRGFITGSKLGYARGYNEGKETAMVDMKSAIMEFFDDIGR